VVTRTEQTSSGIDTFKLMTAVLVLVAGVVAYHYFENESQLLRVLGMLAVAAVAFFLVATTVTGKRGLDFFKDSRVEVRKVVWPSRQETLQTTIAVVFVVLLVAIALWLVDMFLGWGVSTLLA